MADRSDPDYLKRIYENSRQLAPEKKAEPKKREHGLSLSPVFISLMIFLVVFSSFLGFSLALFSRFMLFETLLTIMPGEKLLSETNLLLLGVDGEGGIKRSDTIMVARVDASKNLIGVISIPRDTRVEIPGRGYDKMNHAFAFGGPDLSRRTAEKLLGVEIPYYVVIDFSGLKSLIDDIGGVEIEVERRMFYIDYAQNLFIDLKPGKQRLKGRDALSYVRYRADGGDITRMLRQQKFLKAIAEQVANDQNIVRSPQIVLKLFSNMDTNMNTKEIVGLALNMRKIYEFGEIRMTAVPGYDSMVDGVYYMQPNMVKLREEVLQYLKGHSS